jgi:hypothetical protein
MSCGFRFGSPIALDRSAVRGAQALGFLENGGQRIVARHFLSLEFDLVFARPGGGADLVQLRIAELLTAAEKFDLSVVRFDAQGQRIRLCGGYERQQQQRPQPQ